jgi:hypothetical protein
MDVEFLNEMLAMPATAFLQISSFIAVFFVGFACGYPSEHFYLTRS